MMSYYLNNYSGSVVQETVYNLVSWTRACISDNVRCRNVLGLPAVTLITVTGRNPFGGVKS